MNATGKWPGWCATFNVMLLLSACDVLSVNDPTVIEDEDVANAEGADLLRRDALSSLYVALSATVGTTGLLSDEFITAISAHAGDQRASALYEQVLAEQGGGEYALWQEVRRSAAIARPALRANSPATTRDAKVGETFAVQGYAAVVLGESFCSGFPLHEVIDFKPIISDPLATDEAFARALADFDSAVALASDDVGVLNMARIGRGRALLGLGQFADAGAAVAEVPTSFEWQAEYSSANQWNLVGAMWSGFGVFEFPVLEVADFEGENGLDFVTAEDPRVTIFEPPPSLFAPPGLKGTKYNDANAPIVIANGIEARLIQAEAALQDGDGNWLTILNELRASAIDPALPPLEDPGANDARVDLLFRERAFWLFGTAHRIGDLRRLIGHYGRDSESALPRGVYRHGGTYGNATSIPFPADLETPHNPAVTGCTSR